MAAAWRQPGLSGLMWFIDFWNPSFARWPPWLLLSNMWQKIIFDFVPLWCFINRHNACKCFKLIIYINSQKSTELTFPDHQNHTKTNDAVMKAFDWVVLTLVHRSCSVYFRQNATWPTDYAYIMHTAPFHNYYYYYY